MIQISQLKLPCTHTQQELREKIERTLRIRPEASDILDGIAEVLTAESTEMILREKC